MISEIRIVLCFLILMLISGCATQKYHWGNYEKASCEYSKEPVNDEKLMQEIARTIERGEKNSKVPPGMYAEYGYFLIMKSNNEEAIKYFQKEREAWPEAEQFMDSMIKNARSGRHWTMISGIGEEEEETDKECRPASILIAPPVNRTGEAKAPSYFVGTISRPLAENGYYILPMNLSFQVLKKQGFLDATDVYDADPTAIAGMFGADAILYIVIESWVVPSPFEATIKATYILKCASTGKEIWQTDQVAVNKPRPNPPPKYYGSSGRGIAAAFIDASLTNAMNRTWNDFFDLARKANRWAMRELNADLKPKQDSTE